MAQPLDSRRYFLWALYAFAAVAVASIALQNFIWVAVALFLFYQIKDRQKIDWPNGLFTWSTLVFMLSFFTAALWGINPGNSFLTVHKYLTILLVFFVGAMPLFLDDIFKLLEVYVYGATFCAVAGIFKHFYYHQDRIDSFSGDKMVFGGMLMVALILIFWLLKKEPKKWWFWICAALLAVALVLTQTRGAWVGFLVGFLILLWKFQRRWFFIGLALLVASYFALPQAYQDRFKSIFNIYTNYNRSNPYGSATQTRFLIWTAGWYMIQDHPWGVGQGNVAELFPQYRPPQLHEFNEPHLHNNFIQLCAQNGWIGLGIYLLWIVSYLGKALHFKPREKDEKTLNWTFLSIFLAALVWGLTEYTFSHQFMNIQFFLLGLQVNLWGKSGARQSIKR